MRHNIPSVPFFRDSPSTDQIQEFALRVVVELPGWEFHVIGTATLIGGHLAITAKHVLDYVAATFGGKRTQRGIEVDGYSLRLIQVLPGPIYRIWNVFSAWITSSDIAILHLGLNGGSDTETKIDWRSPMIRVVPPPTGQKVLAFGYRESKIEVTESADGVHHIVLNDIPTTSAGHVGTIFPGRRDSSMLTFPCFEVRARFAHGTSGGLVIDENGALCGLVCSGLRFDDPNEIPVSYAATLWPMLLTKISADRGDAYPRGVTYPVIDLVRDKILHAVGLDELDPNLFPDHALPKP
jgi:hypothetical protein